MGIKVTGRISKTSKYKLKEQRICLICGQSFESEVNKEGCVCSECIKKHDIKPRRRNSFPCNTNPICKKCAHRVKISYGWICDCLQHTGHIRDLTADDKHCATFEKKGLKNYDEYD